MKTIFLKGIFISFLLLGLNTLFGQTNLSKDVNTELILEMREIDLSMISIYNNSINNNLDSSQRLMFLYNAGMAHAANLLSKGIKYKPYCDYIIMKISFMAGNYLRIKNYTDESNTVFKKAFENTDFINLSSRYPITIDSEVQGKVAIFNLSSIQTTTVGFFRNFKALSISLKQYEQTVAILTQYEKIGLLKGDEKENHYFELFLYSYLQNTNNHKEQLGFLDNYYTIVANKPASKELWLRNSINVPDLYKQALWEARKSNAIISSQTYFNCANANLKIDQKEDALEVYQWLLPQSLTSTESFKLFETFKELRNFSNAEKALDKIVVYNCSDYKDMRERYLSIGAKSKADEYSQKIKECEKEVKKEERKRKREIRKSNFKYNYSLRLTANPLVGLNIAPEGDEKYFKFLPMSADLRIKKTEHEFRWNPFWGYDTKTRFIGGKMLDNPPSNNQGWKNLQGNDYSYSLIFWMINQGYNTPNVGFGPTFLWGNFTVDGENISARNNNFTRPVFIEPTILRRELLLNMKTSINVPKTPFNLSLYMAMGMGARRISYNPVAGALLTEDQLKSDDTEFFDRRFVQDNWRGNYFSFRAGFRIGFYLF